MNELETKIELFWLANLCQHCVTSVTLLTVLDSRMMARAGSGLWQGRIQEAVSRHWPVGLCPNQKAYPAYRVSKCNRCSFYGGFGCLWRIWRIWRIWSVLALHFASGHGLDFGLVPRPLSLRHEITSLWVSPGSLKGRHNMTQRDTQRETRCES